MNNIFNDKIAEMKVCIRCSLCNSRQNVVIGRGSITPYILFVGRDPGVDEDKTGQPFVGDSGKLLDKWIEYIELNKEDYTITNLVMCHTPLNRGPKQEEIDACSEWLDWKIQYLNPVIICTIGVDSTSYFLGDNYKTGITRYNGKFYKEVKYNKLIYPLVHPSFFLRHGGQGWQEQLELLKIHLSTRKNNNDYI